MLPPSSHPSAPLPHSNPRVPFREDHRHDQSFFHQQYTQGLRWELCARNLLVVLPQACATQSQYVLLCSYQDMKRYSPHPTPCPHLPWTLTPARGSSQAPRTVKARSDMRMTGGPRRVLQTVAIEGSDGDQVVMVARSRTPITNLQRAPTYNDDGE